MFVSPFPFILPAPFPATACRWTILVPALHEIVPAGFGLVPGDKPRPRSQADRSRGLDHESMARLRKRLRQFLERFQVQVERFACIGEGTGKCVVTGDDLRDVGKIDRIAGFLGVVTDREYVTPVRLGRYNHKPRTSKTLRTSRGWQVLRVPCGRTTTK